MEKYKIIRTSPLKDIKGILADIDGTLYFKESPTKGAIKTVSKFQNRKKYCF